MQTAPKHFLEALTSGQQVPATIFSGDPTEDELN